MRLHRLFLGNYHVLRNLQISFSLTASSPVDGDYALDFLVGLNGSGKSTVLQALVDIFLRLERNGTVPFPFELTYELGSGNQRKQIRISNLSYDEEDNTLPSQLRCWRQGQVTDWRDDLLPNNVVAFTTGSEESWLQILRSRDPWEAPSDLQELSLEERYIRELAGSVTSQPDYFPEMERERESSRVEFIRAVELPLVTLCGLLEHLDKDADEHSSGLRDVLTHSGIARIPGFSLRFRVNKGLITEAQYEQLSRLKAYATRALRLGSDRLLVFDLMGTGENKAAKLLSEFAGGFSLFRLLAGMQRAPNPAESVLQQVNIFLERAANEDETIPPLHLFDWLSDGEQSFLGRMCLFRLLNRNDTLVLLDEPEVHFNDYWKRKIVNLLDGVLRGRPNYVLISSHSSITLTDVPKEDIIILQRPGAYTTEAGSPSIPTLAADPGDIMIHVFDTGFAAGEHAVSKILRALQERLPQERAQQKQELLELLEQVSAGYWSYRIRKALDHLE